MILSISIPVIPMIPNTYLKRIEGLGIVFNPLIFHQLANGVNNKSYKRKTDNSSRILL